MKKLLLIPVLLIPVLLTSLMAAGDKPKEWEFSGSLNMYLQTVHIDGIDSDREGDTHNEELNLNLTGPLADGEAGAETRLRSTNDERVQENNVEVLYFRSYYKDKVWEAEAGDVASSLNPYIFSGSLKGAKITYKSKEKKRTWNYSVISGLKKASWKELFNSEENESPTGYSAAIQAKYIHERAKEIGISVSTYKDDLSTGESNTSVPGKKGYSVGIDGKWRFNKFITLKGRSAISVGSDDIRSDKSSESSKAIYLKLLTRPILKSVKSNFVYQRIDPNFVSYGGSANNDKEQIENSTSWKINKEYNLRVDLKGNRDNLDGQLSDTTELHYEALSLNYRPSFLKRSSIDLRVSNKGIKGAGSDNITQTAGLNFNLRQKSGWRYSLGYDYSDYDDKNTSSSSRASHTFKVLLGYKQKLSKTKSYRFTLRPSYIHTNSSNSEDKIGLKADLGYVHDKKLSMDLLYIIYDSDYDTSNNTQNSTYQARGTYKLNNTGRDTVRLLIEKKDVNVDNTPESTYEEYTAKLSLALAF